jgi:sortase A
MRILQRPTAPALKVEKYEYPTTTPKYSTFYKLRYRKLLVRKLLVGRQCKGLVGILLLVVGASVTISTAYELWGSKIYESQAQATLEDSLVAQENPGISTTSSITPPIDVTESSGLAIARISIPKISLDAAVVSGTDSDSLKQGPGWMLNTAYPAEVGNSVISGHRTTYGAPFRNLDDLVPGDKIRITRPNDSVSTIYEVRDSFVVLPGDTWVTSPTSGVRLTLTTCHPEGSDTKRLVVQAEAISGPNAVLADPISQWDRSVPA